MMKPNEKWEVLEAQERGCFKLTTKHSFLCLGQFYAKLYVLCSDPVLDI